MKLSQFGKRHDVMIPTVATETQGHPACRHELSSSPQ
jgi:hypothetical protein